MAEQRRSQRAHDVTTSEEKRKTTPQQGGPASRPGPLPQEEGRADRETDAADTGWIEKPAQKKDAVSNPRPGLAGSQQGLEEDGDQEEQPGVTRGPQTRGDHGQTRS